MLLPTTLHLIREQEELAIQQRDHSEENNSGEQQQQQQRNKVGTEVALTMN
jgi:hypothetical protein